MHNSARLASTLATMLVAFASARAAVAQPFNDQLVQAPTLAAPAPGSAIGALARLSLGPGDLPRGAHTLDLPIQAPTTRGPLMFDVLPRYSSEAGLGEWGMGWSVSLAIHRQPVLGDVDYAVDELTSPWGRLVLGSDGYWYPSGFSTRVRVQREPTRWVVVDGAGTRFVFDRRITVAGGDYAWYLTEVSALTGARLVVDYVANPSGALFVSEVRYGGPGHTDDHRLVLDYELLAQPLTRYNSGSPLTLDRRVRQLTVATRAPNQGPYATRWTVGLGYRQTAPSPAFYLTTVTQTFASGATAPTLTYTYDDGAATLDASRFRAIPGLRPYLLAAGGNAIQPTQAAVFDLEDDGRPDLEHAYSQTLVHATDAGWVSELLAPAPINANPLCRPAPSVNNRPRVLARMTREATEPQVLRADFRSGTADTAVLVCSRVGVPLYARAIAGNWALGANVRLVDVDRDRRPDLLRVYSGGYQVLANTSVAAAVEFVVQPAQTLTPRVVPNASWVQDVNGDAVPDLVVRHSGGLIMWPGLGQRRFGGTGVALPFVTRTGAALAGLSTYGLSFVDANADGLADVVLTRQSAAALFLGSGTAFRERPLPGLVVGGDMSNPVVADLRGAGDMELNYVVGQDVWGLALDSPSTGLLVRADDGTANVANYEYARAAARDGLGRRVSVLRQLRTSASGLGEDVSVYDYAEPALHSRSRALIGFGVVRRDRNALTEELRFHHDDALSVPTRTYRVDASFPDVQRIEAWRYDARTHLGLPWMRLHDHALQWADAAGRVGVEERTVQEAYAREWCPISTQHRSAAGVSRVTSTLASASALVDALHCLPATMTVTGTHADATLDFAEAASFSRNSRGQLTQARREGPAGPWVLQDLGYDASQRVTTVTTPGAGTVTVDYDPGTGLPGRVTDALGVVHEVLARDPLTDAVLELDTRRGPTGHIASYRYDARERLTAAFNDVDGSSASLPFSRYRYAEATPTTPALVQTDTLVVPSAATYTSKAELYTGDGAALGLALRIPTGWALEGLANVSRELRTTKVIARDPIAGGAQLAPPTYTSLFSASAPAISWLRVSGAGELESDLALVQDGVLREVIGDLALGAQRLERMRVTANTEVVVQRMDAAERVLEHVDGLGYVTAFSYDALGRLAKVTLPSGRVHRQHFDAYGRVDTVSRDGVGQVTYAYDARSGQLTAKEVLDAQGKVDRRVDIGLDVRGRVSTERHTHVPSGVVQRFDFAHDGAILTPVSGLTAPVAGQLGHLTQVRGRDYDKTVVRNRDGSAARTLHRLAQWRELDVLTRYHAEGVLAEVRRVVRDARGGVLEDVTETHTYDAVGRPSQLLLGGQPIVTFVYDGQGRVAELRLPGGARFVIAFDPVTRGARGYSITRGLVQTTVGYDFDERGHVAHELTTIGNTTWDRTYDRDARGQLIRVLEAGRRDEVYAYLDDGELDTMDDELGARTVSPSQQQVQAGGHTYTLDAMGRVVSRDGVWLDYGPLGQVASARGAERLDFSYDERGERILKYREGSPERGYVAGGVLDSTGFIMPVRVAGYLVGVIDHGAFTALDVDPRGTVISDSGTPAHVSAYGARRAHPRVADAVDYVEKGYDADLGAVRVGLRDYDPVLGRFWSADPVLLERLDACAGRPLECNLFSYAAGDPVSIVDRTGAAGEWAVAWGATKRLGQYAVHWVANTVSDPMGADVSGQSSVSRSIEPLISVPRTALDLDPEAGTLERLVPTNHVARSWVEAQASEGEARGAHLVDAGKGVVDTILIAVAAKNLVTAGARKIGSALSPSCVGACGLKPGCFTAGTLVQTSEGPRAIETIAVGDRVTSDLPCEDSAVTGGDAWAVAVLRTEGAWIEALRPRAWLAAEGVTPGALTWIEVEELGVRGDAEVVAVRDAPVVGQGQGCVVLTTMLTQSDAVVSVVLDDDTRLEATSGHPLRSADRDAWVAAGALKRGERVTTADGVRVVRAVAALGGARRVFNLEVETRHTYYAGEAAVLAHNNCGVGGAPATRHAVGTKVRWAKQNAQHIAGTTSGKSYVDSLDDAQQVLDAYHGGRGTVLETIADQNRVIFRYEGVTGTYVNAKHGISEASNVFMIKGNGTATVVPVNPLVW